MKNKEIAAILDEIADLLEIQGEQAFRINSYRRAARTLKDLAENVEAVAEAGKLGELSGVGKGMTSKIEQYLREGKIDQYDELRKAVPDGLPALLRVPGMGPKKVALAWKELGVSNMEELKAAIADGRLAKLKGMGARSVEQIAEGIAFAEQSAGRTPLGLAWPLAEELAAAMRKVKGVGRVDIAGSLRRGQETIGDVDVICESDAGAEVVRAFTELPQCERVLAKGNTKGSIIVRARDGSEIQADCRVVPKASFGSALQYFTGSKEHNVRLRERAVKRGWKLNEWGLFEDETSIAGADEASIYEALELPCFPPELREDRGEFDEDLPEGLIALDDVRGDLHMHTTASDGTVSAEAMARAAHERGYEYIAITDHSKSSAVANGLSIDRMWRQIDKVRRLNDELDTVTVLVGCECDILADGSLDYPDSVLAACDFVVASVHSAMRQPRAKITGRILVAMDNPYVTLMGHPTARLINKREPMDVDIQKVVEKAAATHTALELNASWQRLDLKDVHLRLARDAGVMLCINTDAHSVAQLDQMKFGIMTARRGWLRADDVLNTRPLAALRRWMQKKRGDA